MEHYNQEVIQLNEPKNRQFFPEQFSNEIYYSKLEGFSYISYRSNFSIKYVIQGEVNYILDGKPYKARAGQYLLVNDGRIVETTPDCHSEAISIFLNDELISEVSETLNRTDISLLDRPEVELNNRIEFFENAFPHSDMLGNTLKQLYRSIISDGLANINFTKETYFDLAEKLVGSQKQVDHKINSIDKVRRQTREELYRRILLARDFLEDHAASSFDFETLSAACMLSKYHLIRVFKAVFDSTPYQYHLNCKLNTVKVQLLKPEPSITQIAYENGFTDIYSFSRSFKRNVGMTPTDFRMAVTDK